MTSPRFITIAALAALGQPPQPPKGEPLPVDLALEAACDAYARKPSADEITVKFKAPGAEQRSDRFVVRLEPGDTPRSGPRRMFLDLGQLKVYAEGGTLTAVNTAAPGKYVQREYTPPLTPATLVTFMPPVPLPQLALADEDPKQTRSLTPYTPEVRWATAEPDMSLRPPTVSIQGSGPTGPSTLTTSADTGRVLRLTATIHGRAGDSTLELTSRAVDPGDPASWAIKTEGRERVASVGELKPTPPK
jgi:hypothetical protein